MEVGVILAVIAYAGYRIVQFRKYKIYDVVPRIQVADLAARLIAQRLTLARVSENPAPIEPSPA